MRYFYVLLGDAKWRYFAVGVKVAELHSQSLASMASSF